MSEVMEQEIRLIRTAEGAVELWDPGEQRVIRASFRTGVWGVGGGVALSLLALLGVHLPLGGLVGGLGFVAGGVASAVASVAVLRRVWKGRFRHLTAAAALGLPFGLSAIVYGAAGLSRDVSLIFHPAFVRERSRRPVWYRSIVLADARRVAQALLPPRGRRGVVHKI